MARDRATRNREGTLNAVDRQAERTSRACSLLFQSWMQMGSEMVVGSARIMADTLQDLNDLYCDPRGGPESREPGPDKRA
jgi:hypothetical protein